VTPEQVRAARIFGDFLMTPEQQAAVVSQGLRPGDSTARLGPPIEPSLGANPHAALQALEVPDPLVVDRVIETWHVVKKPAMIAVVFDKSGSMAGAPLNAAIVGARAFIERMDRVDWLFWMPFDDRIYPGARGTKAEIGERLVLEVGGTTAGGGTALYDAILEAHTVLQEERQRRGDSVRYGIVVLSDGKDTASRRGLTAIDERLRPTEHDPTGVQIHAIAIGGDADEKVLQRIANSAHGKFWKGKTAPDMVTIYQEIATHY
jgi:Ca-activated chloride channel family protein